MLEVSSPRFSFVKEAYVPSIVISLTFHLVNDTLKEKFYRTGKLYLIQQDECILQARFVFHLILGYFVKASFDCSCEKGAIVSERMIRNDHNLSD